MISPLLDMLNHLVVYIYKNYPYHIELFRDIASIGPLFYFVKYLMNKQFLDKREQIDSDLSFRNRLEHELDDHVHKEHENNIKDIAIRFVYWKNYPYQLYDDGYKHFLHICYLNGRLWGSRWLNKIGLFFVDYSISANNYSLYVDSNKIFFCAPSNGTYSGFVEYKDVKLVLHLPFTSIVNFDFREKIDYEPIFYIKYPHTNYKKLYSSIIKVRTIGQEEYTVMELNLFKRINKYSWIRYHLMKLQIKVFYIFYK